MSRPVIRIVAGLLGAAAICGVAVALAFTIWAGQAGNPIPRVDDVGWLIPAIVAGLVALLCWALLMPRVRRDTTSAPTMVRCSACDAAMMQGWRICPYCGVMKDEGETSDE